jgi:4-amino-4-deoxy-L-arabinose transferase-like glycosyltransferase
MIRMQGGQVARTSLGGGERGISARRIALCAWPGVVLACAVLVPYLAKAFTVDDTLFLRQAQHALSDPLHPAAFDIVWFESHERLSRIMPSGPVVPWLLVPTVVLGGSEIVGHLTTLLLYALGIAATVSLALRLGGDDEQARLAGLYMVTMPATIGMAATVMPDVAAMTLGVVGLERLVLWSCSRRWSQGVAAALALALASLARTHLLLLLGVGALLLVEGSPLTARSWSGGWRTRWLPLVGAPLLVGIFFWLGREPDGAGMAQSIRSFAFAGRVDRNVLAFFSHWAWSMSFALGWCLLRWRRILGGRIVWMAVPTTLWLLVNAGRGVEVALGLAVAVGILAICDAVAEGWQAHDARRLALSCWLLIALPLLFYIHLPPKYLVASAPAGALLLARATLQSTQPRARMIGAFVGAMGLVLGILIVRADVNLARVERRAARTEIVPRVAAGQHVWFSGHWGFQWYAEQAGARPLVRNPRSASAGDIVLVDEQAFNQGLINDYPHRRLLSVVADPSPGGRIMNREVNAGFYSNDWGDLPWTWSRTTEANRISVWQIE